MVKHDFHRGWAGLILLGAVFLPGALAGCQQELFANSDAATTSKLRYYGDDSALETSASRKKTSDMGFGFPTGSGLQQ